MLMGVLSTPVHILLWYVRVSIYTQRGFLHCLFDNKGFPSTSESG